ncbi:MAG TPA: AI-2E family transporter [Arachnia sp.]|nr:AI-2E family transporter [Arachnia sp.]
MSETEPSVPATPPTTQPATTAVTELEPTPPVARRGTHRRSRFAVDLGHPFMWGFTATAGALVAISLGGSLSALSTVLVSIGAALFIAMALEPVVLWLGNHRMSRGLAIAVVFAGFALILGGVIALIAPAAVGQVTQLAAAVPGYISNIQNTDWFKALTAATGQSDLYEALLARAQAWLSNPENLLAIGGGALAVSTGLVDFVSTSLIVLVLTLYFLASLDPMKRALQQLAPAHARPQLGTMTDRIVESVGGYVSGMAILAAANATFTFILMTILGAPFAALLSFLALFITFIPMIGPVLSWILITTVTLFSSPVTALIFAVVMFAYMQIEAYVLTPRVMTKAVDIPGSLVLIGAMVGATLLGLLGALVAVPVTASLLMIIKEIYIPRQDAKVRPES